MHLGEPAGKKAKRFVWGALGFLTLLFAIAFRREILWLFGMPPAPEVENQVLSPLSFVFFNCIVGFLFFFWFWTVLISYQAMLPISNILVHPFQAVIEAYRASWYFLFHILRLHGPATFIKDGIENATKEDIKREGWPGVVVVDFNSAVVLEERNPPPGMNGAALKLLVLFLQIINVFDARESPRVRGSGIVFTRPLERIRGVVDLRKQSRFLPQISCYTRDGIELQAGVSSVFTIGQDADILQVTYSGVPAAENLRMVTLSELPGGYVRITGLNNELDEADRREIHTFAQQRGNGAPYFQMYTSLPPVQDGFNPQRVFAAVYAQARNSSQEVLPWTELPTRVAAGFYRDVLSQINYDELYDVRLTGDFPMPQHTAKLRQRMRSNGILSYRLLFSTSGQELVQGRVYGPIELQVSQVRALENPKVLRDRGIKVIASGFGELVPVNEAVYLQRLNAWQAGWDRQLDERMATSELETMRVRGRAHVEAQQDLWRCLAQLFEQNEFTDEALALRVLQALDQAAADPGTRALLPNNTIDLMRHLSTLLLPPPAPSSQQKPLNAGGGGGP